MYKENNDKPGNATVKLKSHKHLPDPKANPRASDTQNLYGSATAYRWIELCTHQHG